MSKLIGFNNMKKTEGKVLFLVDEKGAHVGKSCDMEFVYGDASKKVTEACVGRDVTLLYEKGYDGKARVSDVNIK